MVVENIALLGLGLIAITGIHTCLHIEASRRKSRKRCGYALFVDFRGSKRPDSFSALLNSYRVMVVVGKHFTFLLIVV